MRYDGLLPPSFVEKNQDNSMGETSCTSSSCEDWYSKSRTSFEIAKEAAPIEDTSVKLNKCMSRQQLQFIS